MPSVSRSAQFAGGRTWDICTHTGPPAASVDSAASRLSSSSARSSETAETLGRESPARAGEYEALWAGRTERPASQGLVSVCGRALRAGGWGDAKLAAGEHGVLLFAARVRRVAARVDGRRAGRGPYPVPASLIRRSISSSESKSAASACRYSTPTPAKSCARTSTYRSSSCEPATRLSSRRASNELTWVR